LASEILRKKPKELKIFHHYKTV